MKITTLLFGLLLITSCNESNQVVESKITDSPTNKVSTETEYNDSDIALVNGNVELPPIDTTITIIENNYVIVNNPIEYLTYLSQESKNTDCYLVSTFNDNGLIYAVVDFVTVKETSLGDDPDNRTITIENKSKKLRTFTADLEYFKCGHSEKKLLDDLLSLPKKHCITN